MNVPKTTFNSFSNYVFGSIENEPPFLQMLHFIRNYLVLEETGVSIDTTYEIYMNIDKIYMTGAWSTEGLIKQLNIAEANGHGHRVVTFQLTQKSIDLWEFSQL
ncbi:MAG: hypothetical protein KJO69_07800 [Gammaproteobacteria bacterium]|nr:hypothetical protein [Gammaproteobacteria bacterium]